VRTLFLLDGLSGPVKADLVDYLRHQDPQEALLVTKFTTRKFRPHERSPHWPLDLTHLSPDQFRRKACDYRYRYNGASYGFHRKSLETSLNKSDNVFLVVRSSRVLERIRNHYSFANVVSVFVYCDRSGLHRRLTDGGLAPREIDAIVKRNDTVAQGYRTQPDIYDEYIITDCTRSDTERHLDRLISKYHDEPQVDPNLVFVVMSFDPKKRKLPAYFSAMRAAVQKVGGGRWKCKTVREYSPNEEISKTVKECIRGARLVIADVTQNRPSVFYEWGFAHGLGKACVITMEKGNPRGFYPGHYPILEYRDCVDLKRQLEQALRTILEGGI
jgi:guanylate kinase